MHFFRMFLKDFLEKERGKIKTAILYTVKNVKPFRGFTVRNVFKSEWFRSEVFIYGKQTFYF